MTTSLLLHRGSNKSDEEAGPLFIKKGISWSSSGHNWRRLLRVISAKYHILALEQFGHATWELLLACHGKGVEGINRDSCLVRG
jgi:hypothetical protein